MICVHSIASLSFGEGLTCTDLCSGTFNFETTANYRQPLNSDFEFELNDLCSSERSGLRGHCQHGK